MADAITLEAPVVVDAPAAPDTGKPQGEKPSLPAWTAQLPKPVLEKLTAERVPYKNLGELWTKFESLEQEVGNGIRVPGKDATDEQKAAYRKAMQIPDAPEGYSLTIPKLPNGVPYNPNLEKWFRKTLFEAGVPQATAEKVFNDWNATQIAAYENNVKAQEAQRVAFASRAQEQLKAEWKDDYPKNIETMKAAVARFGGQDVLNALKEARLPNGITLDNHPAIIKTFYEIGRRMDGDVMVAGDQPVRGEPAARPGLPISPSGMPMNLYPDMEKSTYYGGRYRVKAE